MAVINILNDEPISEALSIHAEDDPNAAPLVDKLRLFVQEVERQTSAVIFAHLQWPHALDFYSGKGFTAEVYADYYDRRPAKDGWPELHYRLQLKTEGNALSEEFRSRDAREVARKLVAAMRYE